MVYALNPKVLPFPSPNFVWGIPTLQFFANPQKIHEKSVEIPVLHKLKLQNPTCKPTHCQPLGSPQNPYKPKGPKLAPGTSRDRGYVRFVFEQIFGLNPEGRLGIEASLIIESCEFVCCRSMDFEWFFSWSEMIHKSKLRSCWFLIGCN